MALQRPWAPVLASPLATPPRWRLGFKKLLAGCESVTQSAGLLGAGASAALRVGSAPVQGRWCVSSPVSGAWMPLCALPRVSPSQQHRSHARLACVTCVAKLSFAVATTTPARRKLGVRARRVGQVCAARSHLAAVGVTRRGRLIGRVSVAHPASCHRMAAAVLPVLEPPCPC